VLTVYTAAGDPALVLELDAVGAPKLSVGHPDRGEAAVLTREALVLWAGENSVRVLDCEVTKQDSG
jgi:hypothetical protein